MERFQQRTKEIYKQHCQNLNGPLCDHMSTTYGIHHDSLLNTSRFFHVTEGLPQDIMHDVLEGTLEYEIKELLKYLIDEKILDLSTLNTRIEMFPYLYPDKDNKPNPISSDTLKKNDNHLKLEGKKYVCEK